MDRAPVFISWSGPASRTLADALRQWLPKAIQTIDPFVSSQDIAAGNVWFNSIGSRLRRSDFAIICVTPDNLDSTWLHFEAGAIGVAHGADNDSVPRSVVPLLLDVPLSDLDPPLSLYQALTVSEGDIRKLVAALNAIAPAPLTEAHLGEVFDRWWPDLEEGIKSARDRVSATDTSRAARSDRELLEELLSFARHSGFADPPVPPRFGRSVAEAKLLSHPAVAGITRTRSGGHIDVSVRPEVNIDDVSTELANVAFEVPGVSSVGVVVDDGSFPLLDEP